MGNVKLEHENIIELVVPSYSLGWIARKGRFLNEKKYPMTPKELNKAAYVVKISSTFI